MTSKTTSAAPPRDSASASAIEHYVQCYGDMLFDLCESVLWNSHNAQLAFRAILKDLRKAGARSPYERYERSWVLRLACERLRLLVRKHGRQLTHSEQIQLDSHATVSARLKQFDFFFHRLNVEDQILLLLRDKYGLPYPEIAAATNLPEGTIKMRRQHALRALEEWVWEVK